MPIAPDRQPLDARAAAPMVVLTMCWGLQQVATKLAPGGFSFLAPMFGALFGVLILGELLSARFALAAFAVGAGIALVNLRRR